MNAIKILLLDRPHPFLEQALQEAGLEVHSHFDTPREEVLALLPAFQGIVMRSRLRADRELLDRGAQLRFIAREGVGVEHIDTEYAAQKGIAVITSPEGSRDTVAEHALGLLLCLMNNLSRADAQVRRGEWIREGNRGYEIRGKTVGILGYGNMGTAFAQRLQGFGCKVVAYDKYKTGYGDAFATAVDLPTLQQESDILSIHISYTPANHHFINDRFLEAFAKPVFVVNTARGAVLDTAALVRGLQNGQVRGAALDVLEYEETSFEFLNFPSLPYPFQYLRQAENVVLSPHIAGWSFESKLGHAQVLAEKIRFFLAGH
jgi:D-3-phosphoglycerate dehydrogenase / 2-oxoglutarate reductase